MRALSYDDVEVFSLLSQVVGRMVLFQTIRKVDGRPLFVTLCLQLFKAFLDWVKIRELVGVNNAEVHWSWFDYFIQLLVEGDAHQVGPVAVFSCSESFSIDHLFHLVLEPAPVSLGRQVEKILRCFEYLMVVCFLVSEVADHLAVL